MLVMKLKREFGQYEAGAIAWFAPASSEDVHTNDFVLCGLNDDDLFPHFVTATGELTSFGCIIGERCNIRYKAVAVIPAV